MNVLHHPGWLQFVVLAAAACAQGMEPLAAPVPTPAVLSPEASAIPPVSSPQAAQAPAPADADEEPLYAAPTQIDRIGRILAPVMVNGQGPFRFLLDTGANQTTLTPELVTRLGLQPAVGKVQIVHGVTGSAEVGSVLVERVEAGALLLEQQHFPIVPSTIATQADGILGVAGLERARVYVDFRGDRVIVSRSRVARHERGTWLVIDARRMDDGLLAVDARVRGVRARAIIDTGAERTLGNLALREAVRSQRRATRPPRLTDVFGATLQVSKGESEVANTVLLGEVRITHVDITYGDFHIFHAWGLTDRPAMLIGMDVLGVPEALVIDFRKEQLLVRKSDGRR